MKKIVSCVINDLNNDQRMQRICTSLQEAGYDTTLVGRVLHTSKPISNAIYKQERLTCWFNKGKLFYLEMNVRLFFYLLTTAADIFVANDIDTIMAVYAASLCRGKKRIFDAHELFSEVPELEERPISKAIWRNVEKWFIPRFKYKYTVSESIIQFFKEVYQQDFTLIRNVPLLESTNTPSHKHTSKPYILYQGALNDGRGLEQMIEAMQYIKNYDLYIAGSGDIEEQLKQQVHNLALQEQVHFLGMLDPATLKDITLSASIGINLLENKGLSYYYSLANKFFDYMHAQIPSINMNFPEYQKMNACYETAILIDSLEVEDIQNAIEQMSDTNTYKRLQQNCLQAKAEFNWQMESKKLIELYQQLEK